MQTDTVRIGILGASRVASYALIQPVALRDDCEITMLACRDLQRGQDYARKHNISEVVSNYETLAEHPDIDLVYNALPPSRHADLSVTALNAGKTVLCEKPFAMNADEARAMVAFSEANPGQLIEAFHYRFHPAFERAMTIIQSGQIGKPKNLKAKFVAPVTQDKDEIRYTFPVGGGSLMDMGCYPVHWARTLMGCEAEVLSAECQALADNIDVTTHATLLFENGVKAEIECSMDERRPFHAFLSVEGDQGILNFINPLSPHMGHSLNVTSNGEVKSETLHAKRTYDYQLAHTLDVMRGLNAPITGGLDSILNMKMIDAIYKKAGLPRRGWDNP